MFFIAFIVVFMWYSKFDGDYIEFLYNFYQGIKGFGGGIVGLMEIILSFY